MCIYMDSELVSVENARSYAGEVARLSEAYRESLLEVMRIGTASLRQYLEVSLPPQEEQPIEISSKRTKSEVIRDLSLILGSFYVNVIPSIRSQPDVAGLMEKVTYFIKNHRL